MITYSHQLVKGYLSDSTESQNQNYQIIYSKIGNFERFSMNYLNKLTKKYQNVKLNTKLYKMGIEYARIKYKTYETSF